MNLRYTIYDLRYTICKKTGDASGMSAPLRELCPSRRLGVEHEPRHAGCYIIKN
jgi:hypothetical protein